MEIIIRQDPQAVARTVADAFEDVVRGAGERGATLGLATGSSPVRAYEELVRRHREEGLSFAHTRAFLLDEYIGLPRTDARSYHRFIRERFTGLVDIEDARVLSPDGEAADPVAEAARYDASIREAGGVDIQILGIGSDGHIGFNEPISSLASRTRVKTLTRRTIADNARFFDSEDEVPVHVLTQGLGTIREARRIVLVATGSGKAEAIARAVEGPIAAICPGSVLQLHPSARVVVDEEAASELELTDYYRFVQEHKGTLAH